MKLGVVFQSFCNVTFSKGLVEFCLVRGNVLLCLVSCGFGKV